MLLFLLSLITLKSLRANVFAVKHNFFEDFASQLPKEFSTYAPADKSLSERIAALETENELLKAQLTVLKDVMGK